MKAEQELTGASASSDCTGGCGNLDAALSFINLVSVPASVFAARFAKLVDNASAEDLTSACSRVTSDSRMFIFDCRILMV